MVLPRFRWKEIFHNLQHKTGYSKLNRIFFFNRSNPVRPYIVCSTILTLLMLPFRRPLFQSYNNAFLTGYISSKSRFAKSLNSRINDFRFSSIQLSSYLISLILITFLKSCTTMYTFISLESFINFDNMSLFFSDSLPGSQNKREYNYLLDIRSFKDNGFVLSGFV